MVFLSSRVVLVPFLLFTLAYGAMTTFQFYDLNHGGLSDGVRELASSYGISNFESLYMYVASISALFGYVFLMALFLARRKGICKTYGLIKNCQKELENIGGRKVELEEESTLGYSILLILNQERFCSSTVYRICKRIINKYCP